MTCTVRRTALLAWLLPMLMVLPGTFSAVAAERMRGLAVTEERIALVIGNAAYRNDPLDNPVNDAHLIAQSLTKAGFSVLVQENLDRRGLINALREFGNHLGENTIAVLYYGGHGLQLRDRNYLIGVDAEIHSEDEIPLVGVDLGFMLDRMSTAHSRINVVILDACRNNPFSGKAGPKAQGLAQMDAPVGTLLAYSTRPGKLAADGGGTNSLYATHLARQLLTPGLPVEQMFKRVREGVVRDTREQQMPWESSLLQGEFAFVPGVAAPRESTADIEAAGELAFWNSIQASARADEYRAYQRQYPSGRFAALAQARIAAFTVPSASQSASAPAADALPRAGDTWRYRVQDQFRLGDLFLTAKVDEVTADGVAESWTTTSDAKLRTTLVSLAPGFNTLPGWNLTPPEFSPYLQASGLLRPGPITVMQQRRVEQLLVPLRVSVEGEEEISVAAGRFHAIKVVLRGQAQPQTRGASKSAPLSTEQIVWYAPAVKRIVKQSISTHLGDSLREATTFELMEYTLH
jgi:uncharacterized caspase-like protein